MKRGNRPSGDLIPWTISEQYQDESFASLSGVRVVRIATHPSAQGRGYGSKAMELLLNYYQNKLLDFDNIKSDEAQELKVAQPKSDKEGSLKDEKLKPKKNVKPILQRLSERRPAPIHYIGTSFGVTKELFQFWKKNCFVPVYLRQTANELTGEHTCVMIRPINLNDDSVQVPDWLIQEKGLSFETVEEIQEHSWIASYFHDFKRRLQSLLGFEFRAMPCSLAF